MEKHSHEETNQSNGRLLKRTDAAQDGPVVHLRLHPLAKHENHSINVMPQEYIGVWVTTNRCALRL